MAAIKRDITAATQKQYDLIVIGGGIHGAMLALEASLRGLASLIIEQSDFGASTSYNSLRILHGGFRYLQHLDFVRLYESSQERRWFLEYFPEFSSPLPCLMPLYGVGLRRPEFIRPALKAYDLLTYRRNIGLPRQLHIPDGKLLSASETHALCPLISRDRLKGGALWYDGFIPDSQRILIGTLRWACEFGLDALNYVRATELSIENGRATGVIAHDEESANEVKFRGRIIVNAAGPWCRELAYKFDRDKPRLFKSMMAWNVLFDHPAISTTAVAVAPPGPSEHTYFIVPWKGMMFAGTGHAPWMSSQKNPTPSREQLQKFCTDLNRALPGIDLKMDDILHVYAGLQSAKREGGTEFCKREVVIDHSNEGGPAGFFSISGIKFTTARKVAEKAITKILSGSGQGISPRQLAYQPPDDATSPAGTYSFDWMPPQNDKDWMAPLLNLAREESVLHLDDLIIRRTSLSDNPQRAMAVAEDLCRLMNWNARRTADEIERLARHFVLLPEIA